MQPEKTIEIDRRILRIADRWPRNRDGGPHLVIALLAVRHHDIQTVGCAALEDGHENLAAPARSIARIEGALEPDGSRSYADHGQPGIAKKNAARQHDSLPPLKVRRPEQQARNHHGFG